LDPIPPIPKERYTSREFASREWTDMWTRVWLMAGRESDVPAEGDYFTFEIGPESVLLIRQADGSIAARYNVCMHRGNRLREPGRGHAESFACPFHGWRYGSDGRLIEAQDPQSFPQGVPCDQLSLRAVRCDTWGGFVWVNLDPDAPALLDYLGIIPQHLDPYRFEEMAIVNDVTVEIDCNWKTSLDAFNESYHIAATHPWTLEFSDDVNCRIDLWDRHTRMILPLAVASPRHPAHGTVTETIKAYFIAGAGLDPDEFDGGVDDVRPAIARQIREVEGPAVGADFSELGDDQLIDDFHYTVFPNCTFNIHARFAWIFRHRPHPDDPNKMYFDFFNLVRTPALDVPRPEHEHRQLAEGYSFAEALLGGELLDEDMYNLPRVQAGMRSRAFTGLHLGDQEARIRHFHHTMDSYLEGAGR
jgi:nitrite reductase/ring-hydroxylating ferredoxin subunit